MFSSPKKWKLSPLICALVNSKNDWKDQGGCSVLDLAGSHPDVAKPGKAIYLNGTNERMCVLMDCLPFVLYRA